MRHLSPPLTRNTANLPLQYYKVARGGDVIPLIGGGWHNASFAAQVVGESHEYWLDLVKGAVDTGSINYNQTSRPDIRKSYVSRCSATAQLDLPAESDIKPAAPKPERFNQWFYLDEDFQLIEPPASA